VSELFPNIRLPAAVPGYGFGFDETKRLGGPPQLSQDPLFEINYNQPGRVYLRTRTYDTYQGNNWTLSNKTGKASNREVFVRSNRRQRGEMRIKIMTDFFSHLPHTLETASVRFSEASPTLERGNWDTGFHLVHPLRKDDEFFLQIAPSFSSLARAKQPDNMEPYLQIPEDMPPSVRGLAQKISEGVADEQTVLERIIKYLSYNYSYTLDMEDEYVYHDDFVTDFLFGELQGYCVHFATSFTLLARLNGIPTRYATGFVVDHGGRYQQTVVTGQTSHAWPEVWMDGRGWTLWEATPSQVNVQIGDDDQWLFDLVNTFDASAFDRADLAAAELFTEANRLQGSQNQGWRILSFLWIVPALLLAGGFFFLRGPIRETFVVNRRDRSSMLYLSAKLVSEMKKHGVDQPERYGWIQWGNRIARKYPTVTRSADRVSTIINHSMFGRRETAGKDVEYLRLFGKKIKQLGRRGRQTDRDGGNGKSRFLSA
jgi:transglutaminase-like putative cysteine protease